MQVQSLGWEDLLEEGIATHSSILAWMNYIVPIASSPAAIKHQISLSAWTQ